jgi:hypothetical protein
MQISEYRQPEEGARMRLLSRGNKLRRSRHNVECVYASVGLAHGLHHTPQTT